MSTKMYIKHIIYLLIITFVSYAGQDKYRSYSALKSAEIEGQDYKITTTMANSPISVFAVHGGDIDWGTSAIAKAIAGQNYSIYLFEGLKKSGNLDLHITSHRFDEPRALALATKSQICVSIHGHKNSEPRICLGGNNSNLKKRLASDLYSNEFKILMDCPGLNAEEPNNIVNRCKKGGVQLEFSAPLRKALLENPNLLERLATAVKKSLIDAN